MKQLLTVLIVLTATVASAQETWHYGIKADINLSGITGNGMGAGFGTGFQLGGFAERSLGQKWYFQPELLFSQTNTKKGSDFYTYYNNSNVANPNAADNIKLSYINVPLLLKYNFNKSLSILAGPQAGVLVYDVEGLRTDGAGAFKKFEMSLNGGLQFNITNVALTARYNIGLNDINNIDNRYAWKSQHILLGIAIRIK